MALNDTDEIIAYAERNDEQWIFVFFDIKDKGSFLCELLTTFLPDIMPSVFPSSQRTSWMNDEAYYLPNQKKILERSKALEDTFIREKEALAQELKENRERYGFLHALITGTGSDLVSALVSYLKWLGFQNVYDMDSLNPERKEEDIQIDIKDGLIVVEVKGIGGTSKDDECSQIAKFRYRRCQERDKLDVSAVYIVNHQRHLPALDRNNPPFTENQIRDAKADKRGLMTTFQLFNLYFEIEGGLIDKKEVMESFKSTGLIEFVSASWQSLGMVKETFHGGTVLVIDTKVPVVIGDTLIVRRNHRMIAAAVESLEIADRAVRQTNSGEVGIKCTAIFKRGEQVFIRKIAT